MGAGLAVVVIVAAVTVAVPLVSGVESDDESADPVALEQTASTRAADPQIGLNFIRVNTADPAPGRRPRNAPVTSDPSSLTEPPWVFDDFVQLGVQAYRQVTGADLLWRNIEAHDDAWEFETPDSVLPNGEFEPIVSLFAMQYASGTPPWARSPDEFEPALGSEAQEYLDAVIERYGPVVKYWELGNEMDHWRAADPQQSTDKLAPGAGSLPAYAPADGYSPQAQGVFLAEAADYIRARDPDAVIVLPGMGGLDAYVTDTWLAGVVEGGGTGFFDIVNYHYYGPWDRYIAGRTRLSQALERLGIDDKPVWLTETGSSSDASNTRRTNYPNSEDTQAADVVRRLVLAYAHGDSLAIWHTQISSSDAGSGGDWSAYGLHTSTGERKPSWFTYQLLAKELIPFSGVSIVSDGDGGAYVYEFTKEDGSRAVVAWGRGSYSPTGGSAQMTSMVAADGEFAFTPAPDTISLSEVPTLIVFS